MLIAWIVLATLTVGVAITTVCLIAKPIRSLLGANSYMAPAQSFYVRALVLAASLGALATVAGKDMPCEDQRKAFAAMEYVWWVADGLEPALWSITLFLMGYVLLLTILFAVLGRYRDQ